MYLQTPDLDSFGVLYFYDHGIPLILRSRGVPINKSQFIGATYLRNYKEDEIASNDTYVQEGLASMRSDAFSVREVNYFVSNTGIDTSGSPVTQVDIMVKSAPANADDCNDSYCNEGSRMRIGGIRTK